MFLCLKEIVKNGSGITLDFKMNISYQCSSKENKCQNSLCFLEIQVLRIDTSFKKVRGNGDTTGVLHIIILLN